MKTSNDLELMKSKPYSPFENAYVHLFMLLEDYYISKSNGIERIKHVLNEWDMETKKIIVNKLIFNIQQSGLKDFDENDLLKLI